MLLFLGLYEERGFEGDKTEKVRDVFKQKNLTL